MSSVIRSKGIFFGIFFIFFVFFVFFISCNAQALFSIVRAQCECALSGVACVAMGVSVVWLVLSKGAEGAGVVL